MYVRVRVHVCVQGIIGHGYLDELVIPIIENTPVESELTDSLREAILKCVQHPTRAHTPIRSYTPRGRQYAWGVWKPTPTQPKPTRPYSPPPATRTLPGLPAGGKC